MDDRRYPARELVGWFWRGYARQSIPVLLAASVFMVIEGGSLGALAWMVKPMFDQIFAAGDKSAVIWVGLIVFALFIGRGLSGFLQRILMGVAARMVATSLQISLMRHVVRLDSAFFLAHSPGKLMERVRGDTSGAVGIVSSTFSALGRDVVAVVSLVAVALSIDWLWTLVALIGAPLIYLPVVWAQRLIRRFARRVRILAADLTTRLDETFHGIDTIKLNAIEDAEAERQATLVRRVARMTLKTTAANASIPALMDVVAAIGFFGVLTYGGIQIIDGTKSVGDFMSFFTAIGLLFEPLRRLGKLSGDWQKALVSMERVYTVFQQHPEITSPAEPRPLPAAPETADISFEGASFAYGDLPVLRDVSFVAEAGRTTALVGASGAGKTTVFKALARLVDLDAGRITIGGTDIREADLAALRGLFAVVTQDTMLFDETIRRNILLGREEDPERLQSALEGAFVSDFLSDLPDGLDTPVGPRGANLSGGQRQRVAIARALYRDAPILLLDEATSALDTKSEQIVQKALDRLAADRTTLVIAHRLSTIRDADRIIVMDQGRIVDQGSHDELIARDGLYAGLCRVQFGSD